MFKCGFGASVTNLDVKSIGYEVRMLVGGRPKLESRLHQIVVLASFSNEKPANARAPYKRVSKSGRVSTPYAGHMSGHVAPESRDFRRRDSNNKHGDSWRSPRRRVANFPLHRCHVVRRGSHVPAEGEEKIINLRRGGKQPSRWAEVRAVSGLVLGLSP